MSDIRIDLDWSCMLGFDQASPGPDPFRHSPKIGPKEARGFGRSMAAAKPAAEPDGTLQAKVGNEGRIGR